MAVAVVGSGHESKSLQSGQNHSRSKINIRDKLLKFGVQMKTTDFFLIWSI